LKINDPAIQPIRNQNSRIPKEKIIKEPFLFDGNQFSDSTALCVCNNKYILGKNYYKCPYFADSKFPEWNIVYKESESRIDISVMVFENFNYTQLLDYYNLKVTEFSFDASKTVFLNEADFKFVTFKKEANLSGITFVTIGFGDVCLHLTERVSQ
jgi:hypothetical protein